MNAILFRDAVSAWNLAGWTMIHFLWLGTLVVLIAFITKWLLRRGNPNIRYVVALTSLGVLTGLPLAIALVIPLTFRDGLGEGSSSIALIQPRKTQTVIESTPIAPEQLTKNASVNSQLDPSARPSPNVLTTPAAANIDSHASANSDQLTANAAATLSPGNARTAANFPGSWNLLDSCVSYLPWLWLIGTPITFAITATGIMG